MIDFLILLFISQLSSNDFASNQLLKTINLDLVKEDLTDTMNIKDSPLNITTDKQTYNIADSVNITITNTGESTIVFPDSSLGLEFVNTDTGESFGFPALQVLTTLGSNESNTSLLNLTDTEMPKGKYKIILKPLDDVGQNPVNITIK